LWEADEIDPTTRMAAFFSLGTPGSSGSQPQNSANSGSNNNNDNNSQIQNPYSNNSGVFLYRPNPNPNSNPNPSDEIYPAKGLEIWQQYVQVLRVRVLSGFVFDVCNHSGIRASVKIPILCIHLFIYLHILSRYTITTMRRSYTSIKTTTTTTTTITSKSPVLIITSGAYRHPHRRRCH